MSVRLHRLTMVAERDGVMVGRPDTGSYALFPEEGAETLRLLEAGKPVDEVAAWYERECGTPLDFDDFFEVLDELGFLVAEDADAPVAKPVRWQRAGRWAFSWPAWCLYVALMVGAVVAMVRVPSLRPSYEVFFFTDHISLIPIVLTFTQIPLVLLHEWFHVLAGRRLGLPSTLGIGRRLYYLVAETRLDALLSVPRRQRYLPFLAGMLLDAILVSVLTLTAGWLMGQAVPAWVPGMLLAISFSTLLRLVWQFMFYLETDLYHVIATALRCADLQNATRFLIRSRVRRWLGRSAPVPEAEWTDRDLVVARWYAPLLVLGYGFSLGSLAWAGIPTVWRFWSTVFDRVTAPDTPTSEVIDTLIFLSMAVAQLGLLIYVTVRDRRARNRTRVEQGALA
ncbi:hypothetical protein AB0E59_11265 [Lentzea sp. NPDC034063]|uniref:hypothetical protein n=1 Tax=unclassified Lentzea TaxID=2643253 RepID=UPI0033C902E1